MRHIFIFLTTFFISLAAQAQHAASPIVIIGEGAPAATKSAAASAPVPGAAFPNFPENAITRVGENTNGEHIDSPAAPASPPSPANPSAAASPATPANPASPATPASPVSKLWPRDTISIFLPPCTGLRPQFIVPCTCVITKLMMAMGHDEFLAKSEAGSIESDPRLIRIRQDCATAPQRKEE
jgi:hypothetical protein